jgi:hypothetical protein
VSRPGAGPPRGRAGTWLRDLALGFRLAVGGSRNHTTSWVRLGVGAFGIALAVAVLLGAASAGSVLSERDARQAAQTPDLAPRSGVAPTFVRQTGTEYHGEYIGGTFVQHSGSTSPVPAGVPRQLKPGEMVVSPALDELLSSPGGELLRERFEDYRIVGTLTKDGVVQPADLRFVAGSAKLSATRAGSESGAQPAYGFGGHVDETPMPIELLVLIVLGAVVLIVPLLIFVQASSRIAGAERDRRLAAVRLVGGDAQQVRRIAAAEALLPAAAGLLLGVAVFYALRPLAGELRFFDISVYPEDVVPAAWAVVLIVVAVPLMAVASAVLALRRTVIEPLGVVRQGKPKRRRSLWWRLAITGAGIALLVAASAVLRHGSEFEMLAGMAGGGTLLVIGVASLLPWAVELAIARAHGGPPTLQLAARRLQLDAGTSARVVSGVVVVLTGAVAVLVVLASMNKEYEPLAQLAEQPVPDIPAPTVQLSSAGKPDAELVADLAAVAGVRGAHVSTELPVGAAQNKLGTVVVGDCYALRHSIASNGNGTRRPPLRRCADGDVFLPGRLSEPGSERLTPGDRITAGGRSWQIPRDAHTMRGFDSGYFAAYVTPGAFGAVPQSNEAYSTVHLDADLATVRQAVELNERIRNAVGLESEVWVSSAVQLDIHAAKAQELESVRSWIFAGAVVVLAIAALSVLVLAVEQVRERRRALAAVSASGVGFGTLARSLLWQNAIPFCIGALLAVTGGIVLAYLVLRIPETTMSIDWGSLGVLLGAAAALVLLVTLLCLPMLRAAVSVKNLRTE